MPNRKEYKVRVYGVSMFPIDMLRYDRALPATEEDSSVIAARCQIRDGEPAVINLRSQQPPTRDRWQSFGWQVLGWEEV